MITLGRIAAAIAAIVLLITFISVAATNIRLTKVNAEYERIDNSLKEQQSSINELLRRTTLEKEPIQPESDNFYQPSDPLQSNPPCCGCR